MLDIGEMKDKLRVMLGLDIKPRDLIYKYYYEEEKNPIKILLSCILVDIEDTLEKQKEKINYLPLDYYTFRCLCQYYGSSESSVSKCVGELIMILEDLRVDRIGIRIIGNYTGSTQPLRRVLKAFASQDWIPCDFDTTSSKLVIKNNNSKN